MFSRFQLMDRFNTEIEFKNIDSKLKKMFSIFSCFEDFIFIFISPDPQ